jgi:UDP-glucose 4-epimerase
MIRLKHELKRRGFPAGKFFMHLIYDNVLVTGGAGFIGSHTVDALLNAGVSTWIIDDLSTGSLANLRQWKNEPKFHFRRATILNYKLLEHLARRVDAIIHLGAVVSPLLSIHRPEVVNRVNVSGTVNVLRAAVAQEVNRIVFASSSSVYGDARAARVGEDDQLNPITPYGASKLAAEKYCQTFCTAYGIAEISLRYFNVYGERQSANPYSGVIAIFTKALLHGQRPIIYGDGRQTRDFVHVSDVVSANLLALQSKQALGQAFNIGTGHATSIAELYKTLAQMLKRQHIRPIFKRARTGDIRRSCANLQRTCSTLAFEPKVTLRSGLAQLVRSSEIAAPS